MDAGCGQGGLPNGAARADMGAGADMGEGKMKAALEPHCSIANFLPCEAPLL